MCFKRNAGALNKSPLCLPGFPNLQIPATDTICWTPSSSSSMIPSYILSSCLPHSSCSHSARAPLEPRASLVVCALFVACCSLQKIQQSFERPFKCLDLYSFLDHSENAWTPSWSTLGGVCFHRSATLSDGSASWWRRLIRSWPASSSLTQQLKCNFAVLDCSC